MHIVVCIVRLEKRINCIMKNINNRYLYGYVYYIYYYMTSLVVLSADI